VVPEYSKKAGRCSRRYREEREVQVLVGIIDNGSQYTSNAFRRSMSVLGLKLEHIAVNTPEQNGHIESFHKTLNKEYVWTMDFQDYQQAEAAIKEAFLDYNQHRIHSSLRYLTPYESVAKCKAQVINSA